MLAMIAGPPQPEANGAGQRHGPGFRHRQLRQEHVTLAFAEMKGRLERYALFEAIGPDRSSPPLAPPVDAYLDATNATLGRPERAPGRSARPPLDRGGSERLEQPQQLEPP